ncbi:MAG: hypothetical protein VB108_05930, partial [Anaerolineaceae bacterium]|nr:hypothetical protein [Anaerolineaceae bacterium]
MKDFLIVYFSRTGNCERAAKSLAQDLELNVCPIAANENWNGLPGILRYSLYKITKKQAAVTLDKRMLDAKRLILVSPLWDAQLALPVQTALLQWENKEIYL